jgi:hypothetical protein
MLLSIQALVSRSGTVAGTGKTDSNRSAMLIEADQADVVFPQPLLPLRNANMPPP